MLTSLLNPVLRLHAVYGTQLSYVNVSRLNDNVMNETAQHEEEMCTLCYRF